MLSRGTHQCNAIKRLLLSWLHHFNNPMKYNMDNMRISGIEPLSVIFSQTKNKKTLKRDHKNV